MNVRVEFYGIPRERAGTPDTMIEIPGDAIRFGDVLFDLVNRFPRLADTCFDNGSLRPEYRASIDGHRFVSDPDEFIRTGEVILIMSADAGG
jgi:molybdopterin converting factor small subunit